MYRVSEKNIYLKLKRHENRNLLVQGYRGAFDIVDDNIISILKKAEEDPSELNQLEESDLDILKKRGYLTDMTVDEELETIKKISGILNQVCCDSLLITIMPTYNCNFRCEYCFEQNLLENGKAWLSGKMTLEMVDAIFEQLIKFKESGRRVMGLYLFGGEPLLSSNREIVEYICKRSREIEVPISCISNGYDLDKYIDLIKEYKFDKVQITVDGIAEEHDKRRFLAGGQGSYDRIMRNIDLALKNGIRITVRTNVNKKNMEAIDDLKDEYVKRGWTELPNFSYYFKSTIVCYEEVGNALSDVELMNKLGKKYGEIDPKRFQFNSIYQGLYRSLKHMIEHNTIAPLRSGYCGAHTGMYTIDPYGDIYPCWDVLAQESCKIGHVDVDKGEFILNDNHDKWKKRTVDKIDDCKHCRYAMFCGGGCSAQAKVMHDDINKVFCDDFTLIFDEVAIDLIDKLLDEED